MAKGIYYGVNGLPRKIKKIFYGVDGVPRKIKKVFYGVGGVPRLVWSGGEIKKLDNATPLSQARYDLAATTVGNYALFGGGANSDRYFSDTDAYDTFLVHSSAAPLSETKSDLAATTVGDYALFGGGWYNHPSGSLDAYDTSLVKTQPTGLSTKRYYLAATTVGDYALFGGGNKSTDISEQSYTDATDAYNVSLIKSNIMRLGEAHKSVQAATNSHYALFSGHSYINAYNPELTRTLLPQSGEVVVYSVSANVGDYALFADYWGTVDAYDTSLVRHSAPSLSTSLKPETGMVATSFPEYALFATRNKFTDVYDSTLVKTGTTPLSKSRARGAATTVGNYALFGGGILTDTVEVYGI